MRHTTIIPKQRDEEVIVTNGIMVLFLDATNRNPLDHGFVFNISAVDPRSMTTAHATYELLFSGDHEPNLPGWFNNIIVAILESFEKAAAQNGCRVQVNPYPATYEEATHLGYIGGATYSGLSNQLSGIYRQYNDANKYSVVKRRSGFPSTIECSDNPYYGFSLVEEHHPMALALPDLFTVTIWGVSFKGRLTTSPATSATVSLGSLNNAGEGMENAINQALGAMNFYDIHVDEGSFKFADEESLIKNLGHALFIPFSAEEGNGYGDCSAGSLQETYGGKQFRPENTMPTSLMPSFGSARVGPKPLYPGRRGVSPMIDPSLSYDNRW